MKDNHRFLIVCSGDSATFQIVEGMLHQAAGDRCRIFSAGTQEDHVPPEAITIMNDIGVDISRVHSHSIEESTGQEFDYVITVGANEQACPKVSGNPHRLHWPVQDTVVPERSKERRLAAFREIRDQIHGRIMILEGEIAYSTWISQAENDKVVSDSINRPPLIAETAWMGWLHHFPWDLKPLIHRHR